MNKIQRDKKFKENPEYVKGYEQAFKDIETFINQKLIFHINYDNKNNHRCATDSINEHFEFPIKNRNVKF